MSIFAYTGMPGCGKSYNAVEQVIVPALKQGRKVVTNIPMHADAVTSENWPGELVEFPVQSVMQDPETIRDYVTPGCVFVLDEVWRMWPAGDKANKVPEPFKSLLAEHRHMVDAHGNSVSIVLLVQDLANIGAFARRLVEQTFIHTKLSHVGASNRFRVDIFHGPVTGAVGPQSNRLREIFGTYKPEIWKYYVSNTMAQAKLDAGANEKHVDGRGNVLKKPILIVGAISIPCLIAYGIYGLSTFVHTKAGVPATVGSSVRTEVKSTAGPVSPANQGLFAPPVTQSAHETIGWRVVGWIINPTYPERSRAMMKSSNGQRLTVEFEDCRRIDRDPLQCKLEGFWYSETGRTWPDVHNLPLQQAATPAGANGVATG